MKKRLLLNVIFVFMLVLSSNAQLPTPIHTFNFNGSMANTANNSSFQTNSNTGYGTDRFGIANNALTLAGSGTGATMSGLPYGSANRSISLWLKPSSFASLANVIFSYGSFQSGIFINGEYFAILNELSVKVRSILNEQTANHIGEIDNWEHYVFTFDNSLSLSSVYKNGILLSRISLATNTLNSDNTFRLGRTENDASNLYTGLIDDLKIYNVALTDDQVYTLHANELNGSLSPAPSNGLVAYYNFQNNYNSHNGVHNMFEALGGGYSAPTFTTGKYGQAINLSLANGTIRSTNSLTNALTESFTVAFWMMPTGTQNNFSTAFEIGNSCFYRYNSGIPQSYQYGTAIVPTTGANPEYRTLSVFKPRDDKWIHVTIVYKKNSPANGGPATLKLYLNQGGVTQMIFTQVSTNAIYMFNNVFTIGGGTNNDGTLNLTKRFRGLIDEFYVYNRALSASEIANVMNNPQGTLPTKLGNFTAQLKSQTTNLQWSTITEINTSHFEVEYSVDGNKFEKVLSVSAKGNSNQLQNYAALHEIKAHSQSHYYRLKMIDADGKFTYSQIIQVKTIGKNLQIQVYPTVVNTNATVNIQSTEKGIGSIHVRNMQGQLVQHSNVNVIAGSVSQIINMSSFSKGTYLVTVQLNNQQQNFKVIKQ